MACQSKNNHCEENRKRLQIRTRRKRRDLVNCGKGLGQSGQRGRVREGSFQEAICGEKAPLRTRKQKVLELLQEGQREKGVIRGGGILL